LNNKQNVIKGVLLEFNYQYYYFFHKIDGDDSYNHRVFIYIQKLNKSYQKLNI
jgi:hypothetical protein